MVRLVLAVVIVLQIVVVLQFVVAGGLLAADFFFFLALAGLRLTFRRFTVRFARRRLSAAASATSAAPAPAATRATFPFLAFFRSGLALDVLLAEFRFAFSRTFASEFFIVFEPLADEFVAFSKIRSFFFAFGTFCRTRFSLASFSRASLSRTASASSASSSPAARLFVFLPFAPFGFGAFGRRCQEFFFLERFYFFSKFLGFRLWAFF